MFKAYNLDPSNSCHAQYSTCMWNARNQIMNNGFILVQLVLAVKLLNYSRLKAHGGKYRG